MIFFKIAWKLKNPMMQLQIKAGQEKIAYWLLDKLKCDKVNQFVEDHQISEKSGIVIFRIGCNLITALTHALAYSRTLTIKLESENENLKSSMKRLNNKSNIEPDLLTGSVVTMLNERLFSNASELEKKRFNL